MSFFKRAGLAHKTEERVSIAQESACPADLLSHFVLNDTELDVVVAAAGNPNCPSELIPQSSKKLGLWMSLLAMHYKRVQVCSTLPTWEKMALARDRESPAELLKAIVEHESNIDIVMAAGANPKCPIDVLPLASERTGIRLGLLLAQNDSNKNFETLNPAVNRDEFILSHILKRENSDSNTSKPNFDKSDFVTKAKDPNLPIRGHIVLLMCPCWGYAFAPYNIAKLASLLRWQSYKVTVFDMNIKAFHMLKNKTQFNFWEAGRHHLWYDDDFKTKILPLISDYIADVVEEIALLKPDLVGFSLYATNAWASKYVMNLLKAVMPQMPIIVGGPEASQNPELNVFEKGLINYVFVGEAEELLSDFLETKQYLVPAEKKVIGGFNSRIDLDSWPLPDYSDYDLADYDRGTGCSMETSRGCIAQCSFCGEYQLWKFRARTPEGVVGELKSQKEKYGINSVWFVDSLINGNLPNFRKLVDLMCEADLNISWNVYARCNGKMDREFADKVVKAGCSCLSFGVESGSQKILDDMRKNIEVWEIENNLRDFHEAGVANHVNYLIGFPTEDNLDFLHGIILIWNCGRWIDSISPGMGCGAPPISDLAISWKNYGYAGFESAYDRTFLGAWYTVGYKNTLLHRIIRIKTVAILLDIMHSNFGMINVNGHRCSDINEFYSLTYNKQDAQLTARVEQLDNLNLNIFSSQNQSDQLASSVANEFVGIGYLLYKILCTDFNLTINFNPAIDYINFGSFNAVNYTASINLNCQKNGDFKLQINHHLKHEALSHRWKEKVDEERLVLGDKSFQENQTFNGNFQALGTISSQVGPSVHPKFQKNREAKRLNSTLNPTEINLD